MRYELNFQSEPFETYSEFDEESGRLEAELADLEWEEEVGRRRRPAVSRARRGGQIVSAKRLIKRPLRPSIRPPLPPIRPPRPVIFPTFPLPAISVVEPRPPPQPPAPAGAEPKGAEPAPAGGSPTPPSAEPSAEGSEHVRWVQDSLNRILGLRLPVNGIMGPETRSAVRSFQERQGLTITGLVGPDTERVLIAAGSGQSPGAGATKPIVSGMPESAEPAVPPPRMTQPASTSTDAEFDFEWEVPGAATTCLKGLICLDHFHIPKRPDPKKPGQFIAGSLARLEPKNMNPGFIDATDNLITDRSNTGLQTRLNQLVTTKFQDFLSRNSVLKKSASQCDRVRIALIDLTGPKLTKPEFAGWGSTLAMDGASVPKILALYTAFQLRFDLRHLAKTRAISNGSALEKAALKDWSLKGLSRDVPNLVFLFDIRKWLGDPDKLDLSANARSLFENGAINGNCSMGRLIKEIGFPYIASVTWQSGLRHPTRGGLWLGAGYCSETCPDLCLVWGNNPMREPKPVFGHNATVLSAATFFTLLAQRRLVDDASSTEMQRVLKEGCTVRPYFIYPRGRFPAKCGILKHSKAYWNQHGCRELDPSMRLWTLHDNSHVQGATRKVCRKFPHRGDLCVDITASYAISVLSYPKHQLEWRLYEQLCKELEKLTIINQVRHSAAFAGAEVR